VRPFLLAVRRCALAVSLPFVVVSCKKGNREASEPFATSLIFDNASPDAREALATPVDFRITDDNFARWEKAQANLDRLPRLPTPSPVNSGGNAIDRAVARLESNPRARTAIESADLSVRDFVLETVALAQATEAAHGGKTVDRSAVLADNLSFVQRNEGRLLRARAGGGSQSVASEASGAQSGVGTAETTQTDMQPEIERADPVQSEKSLAQPPPRQSDSTLDRNNGQRARPARDSTRDSLRAPVHDTIQR
jgi:hypothetical protein